MKGVLDFLTGPSLDARILRDNFVFKIVPMLNPDGVVIGNYRCNLAGQDLNRHWHDPSRRWQPEIRAARDMIQRFMEEREVVLFIDLHAHSRKKNVFIYGNDPGDRQRLYPRLLSKLCPFFNFDDCVFKVQKQRERSARVSIYRSFGLTNAYTLEASFCGANYGRCADLHFTTRHYEDVGRFLCEALLDLFDPEQTKVRETLNELHSSSSSSAAAAASSAAASLKTASAAPPNDDSDADDSENGEASSSVGLQTSSFRKKKTSAVPAKTVARFPKLAGKTSGSTPTPAGTLPSMRRKPSLT